MRTLPYDKIAIGCIYVFPDEPNVRYIKLHYTVSCKEDDKTTVIHALDDQVHIVGRNKQIYNNPDNYSHYIQELMQED